MQLRSPFAHSFVLCMRPYGRSSPSNLHVDNLEVDERHFYFSWIRGVHDFIAEGDHEVQDTSIDNLEVPTLAWLR